MTGHPECPDCQDHGTRWAPCDYPWGGRDYLLEFCGCPEGNRQEQLQYSLCRGPRIENGKQEREERRGDELLLG